ncbi:MAG: NmrA family NAD(P)-binding protein [Syntrophobacteraceae bacterium]
MDKILVTGATGQVGGAMIEALVARGIPVRAATRKTTRIRWTDMVQPVVFDYGDPGLHKAALSGVSGLFLVAPLLDAHAPAKLNPFIDEAGRMGVRHIVFISALVADGNDKIPLAKIEAHLKGSGLGYTILRPNFFMENFTTGFLAAMIAHGAIHLAAGKGKTSFISVRDIAEVAATAFQQNLPGTEYNLTGPEALSYTQAARTISGVCDRNIIYYDTPEEAMLRGARDLGMPAGALSYLALLYAAVREGRASPITDNVRQVTGKDPISFAEFARRNAAYWKISKAA